MENLKNLLGDSFKENMTLDEVEKALEGKKFVDLKTGKYVDKEKFEKIEGELQKFKTSSPDFETIKKERDELKIFKEDYDLKSKLTNLGVNEKAFKYVKSDIQDGSLKLEGDDKAQAKIIEDYLKERPTFSSKIKDNGPRFVSTTIDSKANLESKENQVETHQQINDSIRNYAGVKIEK